VGLAVSNKSVGNGFTLEVDSVAVADWQVTPPAVTLTVAVTAPAVDVSKV
jgi:hypothetical protein